MTSACHSVDLTTVLLRNIPADIDIWVFRRQGPHGKLILSMERNPRDPTTAMVWVQGCENARKVAAFLHGRQLYDSDQLLRAGYACNCEKSKGTEADKGNFQYMTESPQTSQDRGLRGGGSAKIVTVESGGQSASTQPEVRVKQEKDEIEVLEAERDGGAAGTKQDDSTSDPSCSHNCDQNRVLRYKCRYCLNWGHQTRECEQLVEYYYVGETGTGGYPRSRSWKRVSVTRIQGLHAGPAIHYLEKTYFRRGLNCEEMRLALGFLINYKICRTCGIAGHQSNDLCQFAPNIMPHADGGDQSRSKFIDKLFEIRRRISFDDLQERVYQANAEFMETRRKLKDRSNAGVKRSAKDSEGRQYPAAEKKFRPQ